MIDANDVEAAVWDAVCSLLTDAERIMQMAEDFVSIRGEQGGLDRGQLADAHRRCSRLEEALARAYADRYSGKDERALAGAIERLEADLSDARSLAARLERWERHNQEAATRVAGVRELAEIATHRLGAMPDRERRRVLDILDVRATVTSWAECSTCAGRGKLPSKPDLGGRPCPSCRMTKWLPTLAVDGVVYEDLLRASLNAKPSEVPQAPGLPFRLDEVGFAYSRGSGLA